MKYLLGLFGYFLIQTTHASQVYTSYEDYYRQVHGVIFTKSLEESDGYYSIQGEHGLCGEEDACQDYLWKIGKKNIRITISIKSGGFQINGRNFSYQYAKELNGVQNSSEEIPLYGISVYTYAKSRNIPSMVCIDGYYKGSGRFKKKEVFLVTNPLGSKKHTKFFHLPNLHSSCLAIIKDKNKLVSYPNNNYIPHGDPDKSTGLLLEYFAIKNGASRSSNRETQLRFIEVGNPFRFSVQ